MATPLAGVVEFTVSVYVVGGGGLLLELPSPPQAVMNRLSPIPIQNAALRLILVIPLLPVASITGHGQWLTFPDDARASVPDQHGFSA
jgi:hypothetical protein